jgi:N-acetylglutamate synthase-like GNAT family acetyltransferase
MCSTTIGNTSCDSEDFTINSINSCSKDTRLFVYHKCKELWDSSSSFKEIRDKINKQFDNGNKFYVKTDQSGVLLGFAAIGYIHMMHQICNLYIDPKYRNQGHGSSMIRFVKNKLASAKIQQVYLWCEPGLQQFYAKNGFTIVGSKLTSFLKSIFNSAR